MYVCADYRKQERRKVFTQQSTTGDDTTSTKSASVSLWIIAIALLQTTHYFTLPLAFSVHYIASFALYINISVQFLCSANWLTHALIRLSTSWLMHSCPLPTHICQGVAGIVPKLVDQPHRIFLSCCRVWMAFMRCISFL